ncbi:MAG: alpha/beta fold hydrolase [Marinovum sp.]|nr:alpha/beta fold hydrolase [Marinovum sp.]
MIWVLICLLVLGVAAAPYAAERRRLVMDDTARADAPGAFIDLKHGRTHYRYFGPQSAPLAVCVHGLTTPSFVFEALAEGLVAKGYRVLVYDHYGRGFSDRPTAAQDREFFVSHLDELLNALGEHEKFLLIGYSMGGAVAAAYTAASAQRVRNLVLVAPAGMGHQLGPLANFIRVMPAIGDWLFMAGYGRSHRKGTEKERALHSAVPFVVDRQQRELQYRGFLPSVLSSLRNGLRSQAQADHQSIHDAGTKVVAIWGAEDDVIPLYCRDKMAAWNPAAEQVVVPDEGHSLPYTHPDAVLDKIPQAPPE